MNRAKRTTGPAGATPSATSPVDTSSIVRGIQWGVLALVAIMPFHAFLSVWLGHLTGHQALWQSWKEALLVLMTLAAALLVHRQPQRLTRLRNPAVYTAVGFVAVALLVTLVARPPLTAALYGLKTDAEFLLAAGLAWLVGDARLVRRATQVLLVASGVVVGFGLLQIYVLPADWLVHFGYGPGTIAPFELVDPAVRSIRILSTLGGPNQLGSFLILPLSVAIWQLLRRPRWWQPLYLVAGGIVLWHSYSRSAVLALAAAVVVLLAIRLPRRWRLPLLVIAVVGGGLFLKILTTDANHLPNLQYYLFHQTLRNTGIQASTSAHASSFSDGIKVASHHLLGLGLGSAGPASFHSAHALIPEDYYLQLAIETGVVGMLLFCVAQLIVGWRLWLDANRVMVAAPLVATLAGIAVINLVLQGWADSSTALVFWSLAGAALGAADAPVVGSPAS